MKTQTQKAPATVAVVGPGSILSETSFYVVQSLSRDGKVNVKDDLGHEITLSERYVKEICSRADEYITEESKTRTEMQEILLSNPRMAMTVAYVTQSSEKTKKDYESEKRDKIDQITNASLSSAARLLEDLIDNPITREIPGKLRVIKGRHYGHQDTNGRVSFIDMEIQRDPSKDYDTRTRLMDPRTIQWMIVNKVKYILK